MTGLCVLAATSVACGGVIRHDVDDELYLQLASQTQYDPCGMVECGLVTGSGSLISKDWVSTAAHVVDEASGQVTFNLGGIEYEGDEWFIHRLD